MDKRTNGRIKIQTFYSGALGAERESIEAVQLGIVVLAVPLLLALARWKHEARARLALAALTGLAALVWLAQRLGPS